MVKDVYLIGGPAAGRVVSIPDEQKTLTVQYLRDPKSESRADSDYAECRYEPKHKGDYLAHEFHWLGEY
jgi:hypothetical protein